MFLLLALLTILGDLTYGAQLEAPTNASEFTPLPIEFSVDEYVMGEKIARLYSDLDQGRISADKLKKFLLANKVDPLWAAYFAFFNSFFEINFSSKVELKQKECLTARPDSRESFILDVSCKIQALVSFLRAKEAEQSSVNDFLASQFSRPLKAHEVIGLNKWLKRNASAYKKRLELFAEHLNKSQLPALPDSSLAFIVGSTQTNNLNLKQFQEQRRELSKVYEEAKRACIEKNDQGPFIIKIQPLLTALFEQAKESTLESVLQEAITFVRYNQVRGCLDLANKTLALMVSTDNAELNDETFFRKVWHYVLSKDYPEGLKLLEKIDFQSQFRSIPEKTLFWSAYLYEQNGKIETSKKILSDLIQHNPLSFYSVLASKRLKELDPQSGELITAAFSHQNHYVHLTKYKLKEEYFHVFKRMAIWSKVGAINILTHELDKINFENASEMFSGGETLSKELQTRLLSSVILNVAMVLSQNSQDLQAFKFLAKAVEEMDYRPSLETLAVMFPIKFQEKIWNESKKYGLDPIFTLSLIRQESAFNTQAQSPVGARGLMQLMPYTARYVKKGTRPNDLLNPNNNVEIGTKYLKKLTSEFDNNLVYALAAYNAGEHRVNQWIKEVFSNEEHFLKTIENIPFSETNVYVKLIYRNIFFYKMLTLNQTDTSHLAKIFDLDLGFFNSKIDS